MCWAMYPILSCAGVVCRRTSTRNRIEGLRNVAMQRRDPGANAAVIGLAAVRRAGCWAARAIGATSAIIANETVSYLPLT